MSTTFVKHWNSFRSFLRNGSAVALIHSRANRMKWVRRRTFLIGALALVHSQAIAGSFPLFTVSTGLSIGHGWNTLPLGAGGLVTGFSIANDSSIVCRTDVGNIYRWSGKATDITQPSDAWVPLITLASVAGVTTQPLTDANGIGGVELVQAPSNASLLWALFPNFTGSAGTSDACPLYYSTNGGATWALTGVGLPSNASANSSSGTGSVWNKWAYYRIAVDPNNPTVVYFGTIQNSGTITSLYTSLNKSGGSDGHTFTPATTDAANTVPFPQFTGLSGYGNGANGICFDTSLGTTTLSAQTVTKRVIAPIPGSDIYETFDGGSTWQTTGFAAAFGGTNFKINCATVNSNGTYYITCDFGGVWRYVKGATSGTGTWTNIAPTAYANVANAILWTDPSDASYLALSGNNGFAYGYSMATAINGQSAETGTSSTWASCLPTSGAITAVANAAFGEPGYLNDIFGQGTGAVFFYTTVVKILSSGDTILSGNQSIWKMTGRPVYNGTTNLTVNSFGRGQEATVSQEAWRLGSATYPLVCPQDFGLPLGGTFTKYPSSYIQPLQEYTASSIEDLVSNGSFGVARITGQAGLSGSGYQSAIAADVSCYSQDAGNTWTEYADFPTALWYSQGNGTYTASGNTFVVNSMISGSQPFIGQEIFNGSTYLGIIVSGTYPNFVLGVGPSGSNSGPATMDCQASNNGGQIIACDADHHLIAPVGFGHGAIPAFTSQARNVSTCNWQLCAGLPSINWLVQGSWAFGPTSKPLAVGFGSDVGTVWAAAVVQGSTTATIYKSTNYGSSFSSVGTVTIGASATGVWLCAVPGHPGHLWLAISGNAGQLWQSTDSGATWTPITVPSIGVSGAVLCGYLSIGAAAPAAPYPTIWILGRQGGFGNNTRNCVAFTINAGSTSTPTWQFLGTVDPVNGNRADLPLVGQVAGLATVRADRSVYQRLYCTTPQNGFAYYNP